MVFYLKSNYSYFYKNSTKDNVTIIPQVFILNFKLEFFYPLKFFQ